MASCRLCREGSVSDGTVNYDVLDQIAEGRRSTVLLATCNRGRLRHRKVALRKIPKTKLSSAELAQLASASAIHQSLHHPNIVALFSSFSSGAAHYQVLELCGEGDTLSRFLLARCPSTLSESEMRGVLRSLVDALVYLRKEGVVHRDVRPANVLLTLDCRVKLSGFSLAIRTSAGSDLTELSGLETTPYTSPEILSCLPYSFPTDLWSLGCLVLECLSGTPPSKEITASKASPNATDAVHMLPEKLSFESRDLISSLLQTDPHHRIPLHRIISHPFFNPAFPIVSLTATRPGMSENDNTQEISTKRNSEFDPSPPTSATAVVHSSSPKPTFTRNRTRHSDAPLVLHKRKAFGEIGNRDLRRLLSDEVSNDGRMASGQFGRRVVSDPTPRKRDPASFTKRVASTSTMARTAPRLSDRVHDETPPRPLIFPSIASRPTYPDPAGKKRETPPLQETSTSQSRFPVSRFARDADQPFGVHISVGTCRPSAFTTSSLVPQTQKATHGHITILPSRALLVDFRESERRKARRGDEVLVVHPSGLEVKIFSAPHLSTPCCLAEPSAIYHIDELPTMYWKQYNDAGHLIERLKQRTPKLILYQDEAKCTLMSNSPEGDIELLFPGSTSKSSKKRVENMKPGTDERSRSVNPTMRIRLFRKTRTLEIAQYVTSRRGGEWTKKVIPTAGRQMNLDRTAQILDPVDWNGLLPLERTGIGCLVSFLRVCEAVETLEDFEWTPLDGGSLLNAPVNDVVPLAGGGDVSLSDQLVTRRIESASKTAKNSQLSATSAGRGPLASLNIAPRPRRVSGFLAEQRSDGGHHRKDHLRWEGQNDPGASITTTLAKPNGRKMMYDCPRPCDSGR